ncbi:hypothetical protein LOTGIDRAFT_156466 [Lottia gigantea]|uniref:Uncharacterized protein n=1 Tax=Lottia gigantea TaxID=225164 RepID=V4B0U9_LOTGI|nr:hypothetical protein LOTGIDRAFT_156466 [Lottia gigantea]ESP03868.1 hypothetical protein LOTGIDRAFT_156466 [Lottia gigantea]
MAITSDLTSLQGQARHIRFTSQISRGSEKGLNATSNMERVKRLISPGTKRKLIGNNSNKTFGVPLEDLMKRAPPEYRVPLVVKKLCDYIDKNGPLASSQASHKLNPNNFVAGSEKGLNATSNMERVKRLISPGTKRKLIGNNANKTFGVPLEDLMKRAPPEYRVPLVVKKLCDYIDKNAQTGLTRSMQCRDLNCFISLAPSGSEQKKSPVGRFPTCRQ